MLNRMFARLHCRNIAPLLTPYTEGELAETLHARVARHLDACPACREEAEMMSSMGALLRANTPAAPEPAADLWKRIEAQILAEQKTESAPARPTRPVQPAQPATLRLSPLPASPPMRSQWRSFALSFGSSGALVAGVVFAFVILVRPQHHKQVADAEAAMAPARPDIQMELRPMVSGPKHKTQLPAKKTADLSAPKEEIAAASAPVRPMRRSVLTTGLGRAVAVAPPRIAMGGIATPTSTRNLSVNAFRADSAKVVDGKFDGTIRSFGAQSGTYSAAALDVTVATVPGPVMPAPGAVAPASASLGVPTATPSPAPTIATTVREPQPRPMDTYAATERHVMVASAQAEEATLSAREAPADRTVSDVTGQMWRHRSMFSFSR